MTKPTEKEIQVARALYKYDAHGIGQWDNLGYESQEYWIGAAQEAIKAMVYPTQAMLEAGEVVKRRGWGKDFLDPWRDVRFRQMVRAALSIRAPLT